MITVKLQGGLGNQMFQYALGRTLAERRKTNLKLDLSWYRKKPNHPFLINAFKIEASGLRTLRTLQAKIFRRFNLGQNYIAEKSPHFNPEILNAPDNSYLEGFWQNENYFKEIAPTIRKEFSLRQKPSGEFSALEKEISSVESISVHVRRGDYVSNEKFNRVHGALGADYYEKAAMTVSQNLTEPHFYIFSDDPAWATENLRLPDNQTVVSGRNFSPPEEMILMSRCRRHIIGNSTFSWWGAWLDSRTDKVVVAPKKWLADTSREAPDIVPSEWIKI